MYHIDGLVPGTNGDAVTDNKELPIARARQWMVGLAQHASYRQTVVGDAGWFASCSSSDSLALLAAACLKHHPHQPVCRQSAVGQL